MISELAIKIIIAAVVTAAISGSLYGGYLHIKSIGYNEAAKECAVKIAKYEKEINDKIDKIEANSTLLVQESRIANAELSGGITTILKNTKGKTLTIIKNGECLPSQAFSDTFNAVNKRVNQSIKGDIK